MVASAKKVFVLDTNVLLHDPQAIFRFQEHDIVIPIVVIEEIDTFIAAVRRIADGSLSARSTPAPNDGAGQHGCGG